MKSELDVFESTTGWVASGPEIEIVGTNEIPDFIAGLNNTESLVLKFNEGAMTASADATKSVSIDLTNFNELTFHIWSRDKKCSGVKNTRASEFAYKISFGNGTTYLVPTYSSFTDVTFDISSFTTITEIKIEPLHDDEDYLILSYMVAVKDEIPRDIFQGVEESLDKFIAQDYSMLTDGVTDKGVLVGSGIAISAGDKYIVFGSHGNWLEKYAVIFIEEGGNSETHQIHKSDEEQVSFNSLYDGQSIMNNYTSASIYLRLPVEFGQWEKEMLLPGITVWDLTPAPIIRSNKEDTVYDSMKPDGTVSARLQPQLYQFDIIIDCVARHYEILSFLSKVVRDFIAREFMWVNGKRIDIDFVAEPTFVQPAESVNEIPKIQYILKMEIGDFMFKRESLVPANTATTTYLQKKNTL